MIQPRMRSVLILSLCILTLLLMPDGPGASAAEKLSISGFVGTSSSSTAAKVNVVLYSKETGQAVDSLQTTLFCNTSFRTSLPVPI